jgi:hypothetical protein
MTAKKNRNEKNTHALDKEPVMAAGLSARTSIASNLEKLQKEIESTIFDSEKAVAHFNKQLRSKYTLIERLKEEISTESTGLIQGKTGTTHLHDIFEEHEAALHRIKKLNEDCDNLKKANKQLIGEEKAALKKVSLIEIETININEENRELLVQLHQSQEIIERLLEKTDINQKQQRRIESFIKNNPNYWECESISISVVDNETLSWIVTQTYINNLYIPTLRFDTKVRGGIGTMTIYRSGSCSPLVKWPSAFKLSNELPLVASQGPVMQHGNAIISELGSSDWLMFCELVRKVLRSVKNTELTKLASFNKDVFINGFSVLDHVLNGWPALLRYDHVFISNHTNLDNYQSIFIVLKNVRLGNKAWPELEYKLASANGINEGFGQNPRLEFYESSAHAFHSWFAESDDDRGKRLELRFAMPYAMDTNVWSLLHDEDKLLLTALVISLPIQLDEVISASTLQSEDCTRWKIVSESLKQILIRNTSTGPLQPTEKVRKTTRPTLKGGQKNKELDQSSTTKS